MRIVKKLALMLALAFAASAVAAASAGAQATITPTGTYTGTENNTTATGQGTLVANNNVTVTCTTSNFTAVVGGAPATATASTIEITALTFAGCTQSLTGGSCTVTVTSLPALLHVVLVIGTRSNWTATSTEAATIVCGDDVVHCEASIDTTLTGRVGNGTTTGDETFLVDTPDASNVNIALGSIACGTAASWTAHWTIDSPATYTISA